MKSGSGRELRPILNSGTSLPPSAQRLVELDQSDELVVLCLRQAQLSCH